MLFFQLFCHLFVQRKKMTNILYFHGLVRDDDSVSSSFRDEQVPDDVQVVNMETSSLYSVIGNVCLACARPQVELINDDDDTSSTTAEADDQVLDAPVAGVNLQGVSNNGNLGDDMSQCFIFKRFSFSELNTATRNFLPSDEMQGYIDMVYSWVDKHTLTARELGRSISVSVKWLKQNRYQDKANWLEEVNSLGQLHHPNLVRLLGYCLENEQRLLVYESVPPRSLKDHLFWKNPKFQVLSWTLRMKVALGAAKGLAFLHSLGKIIHPDFNPSNIFVDKNHNAKLSGFRLTNESRAYPVGVMETKYGDFGRSIDAMSAYACPEYLAKGRIESQQIWFPL